jgi:hypothetical protein
VMEYDDMAGDVQRLLRQTRFETFF